MLRDFKKYTLQILAGANISSIILMFLVGYSDYLNPTEFPMLSNAGLAFPVFLLINLGFLIFWLLFKPRYSLIPFVGFIICYCPVRKYIPINVSHDVPQRSLKVLSYNILSFGEYDHSKGAGMEILNYLCKERADIVCLQEFSTSIVSQDDINQKLNPIYQYSDTMSVGEGGEAIAIYSRYPIVGKDRIEFESKGNLSGAWKLLVDEDTVVVVNNHLETTGLTKEQRKDFKNLLKGNLHKDTAEETSKMLVKKLAESTQKRALEADAVADYIEQHLRYPIIVCGDFNDGPISYAHRVIAKKLKDCYIESGNGLGISYHRGGFFVRIDNVMCSDDFIPYRCVVDSKIKASDHYPIICWIKKQVKG